MPSKHRVTDESSFNDKRDLEEWDRSNRMSLMTMKYAILETFRGIMFEVDDAKKFLEELEKCFAKIEKVKTSILLRDHISMRYKGKGNIREYIMEMSHLLLKLKALKLRLTCTFSSNISSYTI